MKQTVKKLTMVLTTVMLTSCASMFSKSQYNVSINSNPTNQDFEITGENGRVIRTGTTPSVVQLKSGSGYFQSATYYVVYKTGERSIINSSYTPIHLLNLLVPLGGFIWGGLIIDPITGAMWNLETYNMTNVKGTKPSSTHLINEDI